MNDWAKSEQEAKKYKEMYPPGTRLMCLSMDDLQAIETGTKGNPSE